MGKNQFKMTNKTTTRTTKQGERVDTTTKTFSLELTNESVACVLGTVAAVAAGTLWGISERAKIANQNNTKKDTWTQANDNNFLRYIELTKMNNPNHHLLPYSNNIKNKPPRFLLNNNILK